MRVSAAMVAMVVSAPMLAAPFASQEMALSPDAARSISGPLDTPLRRRSLRSVPAARNSGTAFAVMDTMLMRRPSLSAH